MSTTPVPSLLPEDFKGNAERLDRAANSAGTWQDRFGEIRRTIPQIISDAEGDLDTASLRSFVSYSDLRIYTGSANVINITSEGIFGVFVRDDSDTTSSDNGGTVIVNSVGKRYKRRYNGKVNPKWFGFTGSGGAYDTSRFQAALDWCATQRTTAMGGVMSGPELCIPAGDFYLGPVTSTNTTISGDGMFSTIIKYDGANGGVLFSFIERSGTHKLLKNLSLTRSTGHGNPGIWLSLGDESDPPIGGTPGQLADFGTSLEWVYFDHLDAVSGVCHVKLPHIVNQYWENIRFGAAPVFVKIDNGSTSSANRVFSVDKWTTDFTQSGDISRVNCFFEISTGGPSNMTVRLSRARIESRTKIGNDAGTDMPSFVRVRAREAGGGIVTPDITAETAVRLVMTDVGIDIQGSSRTANLVYHDNSVNTSDSWVSSIKLDNVSFSGFLGIYGGAWPASFEKIDFPDYSVRAHAADFFIDYQRSSNGRNNNFASWLGFGKPVIGSGSGSPEGVHTATRGSIYIQTNTGTVSSIVWIKTTDTGNTGWIKNPVIRIGSGSPEGVITAPPGTIYSNDVGGAVATLYVKESGFGSVGWVAK